MIRASTELVEWGDMATAARAAGSLAPAWKKFVKTKFFVAILRSPDDNPKNFLLHMVGNRDDGTATLIISEVRQRLDPQQGDGIVALSGADIVCRVEEKGSIQVVLGEGMFSISKKRVDWLRSGIGVTKGRIATRKLLRDAAPVAPLPVLHVESANEPESVRKPAIKAVPLWRPVLASRFFMPALLSLAGIGALAGMVVVLINTAPDELAAPAPVEAAVQAPPVSAPVVAAARPAQSLTSFTPANNCFTVNLPGRAEEVELSPDQVILLRGLETNRYKLDFEELNYTMEATDYRARGPQDGYALMDAMQEQMIGTDGVLVAAQPVQLRGATGREVRVRSPNGSERAARFAYIGSRFCTAMVTVPNGERATPQIDAFLNSFKLN